jgi:hypothetical protein
MPAANQYTFKHKELLTLLVKEAGLHEGRWRLTMNFGFGAGNFGPTDEEMNPGSVVVVNWVGLQKVEPTEVSPSALTVDAAEVNPAST